MAHPLTGPGPEAPRGRLEANERILRRLLSDTSTELVPTDVLLPADSPRLDGEDVEHVGVLADSEIELPPIIVHRETLRVVDGMHRLHAYRLRQQTPIPVIFFTGSAEDAFLLAVLSNTRHGLPLRPDDRRSAALRILRTHSEMSDRAIAAVAGLSAKTVGMMRRGEQETGNAGVTNERVGLDGRRRPLTAAAGREAARTYIAQHPDASIREIAKAANISIGTANSVRRTLLEGIYTRGAGQPLDNIAGDVVGDAPRPARPDGEMSDLFNKLARDPSLRNSRSGQKLLRWMSVNAAIALDQGGIVEQLPHHSLVLVACAARACADELQRFAADLERHPPT